MPRAGPLRGPSSRRAGKSSAACSAGRRKTDANGRFVWYDAPTTGKVYLDVYQPSVLPASQTIARPETGEVTITLP